MGTPLVAAAKIDALSPHDQRRYQRLRVETFALTWIAYATFYLCRKNLSVAKVALVEEGLTNTQLGTIDFSYLLLYALGQFASGIFCERVGARYLVGFGLIATAVMNLAFGAGSSFLFFVAAYGLNGLAQSTGWPGCSSTFARWFSKSERGTVMGLWCTCYQAGPIVATFLATWFLAHYGWRSAFFGPALFVGGVAVLYLWRQKESPEAAGLPDIETYHGNTDARAVAIATPAAKESALSRSLAVMKSRAIWTLGLTYVVLKFIRYSFLFWLPLYMAKQLGYSASEAGYTSMAFDFAGLGGTVLAGLASDRLFGARRAPVVVIMMVALAVATWYYGSAEHMGRIENIIAIAAIGFFIYGPDSVASGVAAVDCGSEGTAAAAAGFVNGLGSFGAVLSPILVGYVSDKYGWPAVMSLFAPMSLAGALLMATLWRHGGSSKTA